MPEDAASGELARVYDDIKRCLGASVVNLIWRRLAAVDGALPAAWLCVRPLYVDGSIVARAPEVTGGLGSPRLIYSTADIDALVAGSADRSALSDTLDMFRRANLQNLLGLSTLMVCLSREPVGPDRPSFEDLTQPARPPRSVASLPAPIPFDTMTEAQKLLVRRFNAIGAGPQTELEQATLPRILLAWPVFLETLVRDLEALSAGVDLQDFIDRLWDKACQIAGDLAVQVPPIHVDHGTRMGIVDALTPFLKQTLCRMVLILELVGLDELAS